MAIRKNVKRIDPRYFLEETTYRDNPDRLDEFGPGGSNFGPLYPFEKLGKLPDEDLRRLMSSVDMNDLAMSLAKGQSTDQLIDRIMSQVSPRAQGKFRDLMDRDDTAGSGPYFADERRSRSAQRRILSVKKKLGL